MIVNLYNTYISVTFGSDNIPIIKWFYFPIWSCWKKLETPTTMFLSLLGGFLQFDYDTSFPAPLPVIWVHCLIKWPKCGTEDNSELVQSHLAVIVVIRSKSTAAQHSSLATPTPELSHSAAFTGQLAGVDWNPGSSSSSPSIIPLLTIPSFWRWSHARPGLGLGHQNYINRKKFPCLSLTCCDLPYFVWWPGHRRPATPGWPVLLRSRASRPSHSFVRASWHHHSGERAREVWPRPVAINTEIRKTRKNLDWKMENIAQNNKSFIVVIKGHFMGMVFLTFLLIN